jgi:3-deoxy-7-phosphoheptulonate synthase
MIIVMKPNVSTQAIDNVVSIVEEYGLDTHLSRGKQVTIIGIVGDKSLLHDSNIQLLDGVDKIVQVTESYKLANKQFHVSPSIIPVGNTFIGGDQITIMAGPCAIESAEQVMETAIKIKAAGATILRGGAYKPRTSPYSFQGLYLLKEVGKTQIPVLLKRGLASTIDEWLNAAEYIMSEGNPNVVLCERGIRTYETATRNTLDISAVPVLKSKTHLPVIIDPSHATGVRDYILPLSKAALAVGADGLMIEVHPNPAAAMSDGPQSLTPEDFHSLCDELRPYAKLSGRYL